MRFSLFILAVFVVLAVKCAQSVPNDHSQCRARGYLGACNVGKLSVEWQNRCLNLKCATQTKIGDQHVPQYIGKAAVGTICGVSRACDLLHQCVSTPNVPRQEGPAEFYHCRPEKVKKRYGKKRNNV